MVFNMKITTRYDIEDLMSKHALTQKQVFKIIRANGKAVTFSEKPDNKFVRVGQTIHLFKGYNDDTYVELYAQDLEERQDCVDEYLKLTEKLLSLMKAADAKDVDNLIMLGDAINLRDEIDELYTRLVNLPKTLITEESQNILILFRKSTAFIDVIKSR